MSKTQRWTFVMKNVKYLVFVHCNRRDDKGFQNGKKIKPKTIKCFSNTRNSLIYICYIKKMQSLSRLLSIEASVITGRSIFRALPRSRHVDASFSTSRRAVRRAAHASKQNNANEPTSGAAATDAPPPIPTSAIGQASVHTIFKCSYL